MTLSLDNEKLMIFYCYRFLVWLAIVRRSNLNYRAGRRRMLQTQTLRHPQLRKLQNKYSLDILKFETLNLRIFSSGG